MECIRYCGNSYRVSYFNTKLPAGDLGRFRLLVIKSSATEPKHLNDIAVRKAKEHGWQWTSFIVSDMADRPICHRVARKRKI